MREFEIHFVTQAPGPAGHSEKTVTEIGTQYWKMKCAAAIEWLKGDPHTFYIRIGERKVYLVAPLRDGQAWLRTSLKWSEPNRLLELPGFPADFGK